MAGRRGRTRFAAALIGAGALLAVSGCTATVESSEAGMGLPVLGWLEDPPIGNTAIAGTLRVADNGCFLLDGEDGTNYFVVWPNGFDHGGPVVVTDGGSELADGETVTGTGAVLTAADAVALGGGEDSQLGSAIGYCAENDEDVVFLATTTAR